MSGAPAATAIWLSRDTPINYSDGTTDTLPANTPAVLPGGGTSFDRTHDVYVPYTVKGSGVLSIIKESLLPTLTDDYAPISRVELHGIKPYQPEPYLASGGAGTAPTTTQTVLVSSTAAKALSLWNGSSNNSPPSGWSDAGFDDSGWAAATTATLPAGTTLGAGETPLWTSTNPVANTEAILVRQSFSAPVGTPLSASLDVQWDDNLQGVWVNGTLLASSTLSGATGSIPHTFAVPPALLVPGSSSNVVALEVANTLPSHAYLSYSLSLTYGPTGGLPAPGSPAEGDLLYYHSGAWTRLPAGTTGDELTIVAGDPAWTAQPADSDYTDPLTTKGDLVTRSASATVRLGVGSNGQVLTADSTQADGIKWGTPTTGSVTSIDVAAPSPLSSSGGPITSSGTITLAWASGQTANRVLATPDGTTGSVSLRALVAGDFPGLPASQITSGQLAAARGGTGLDGSAAANGTLLIGNGTGYTLATITAGSGVTVTNGAGTVTIAASGGSGTVTSVGLTVPGFLSVSPATITSSGTFSVTLANENAATVFAGPASGSAAAPTFRALQGSDLPPAAAAGGHIHAHGHFL